MGLMLSPCKIPSLGATILSLPAVSRRGTPKLECPGVPGEGWECPLR